MDDEKGSTSNSAPTATTTVVTTSFVKSGDRQRFTVELRSDETTIVSWKKLIKDANNHLGRNSATRVNGVGPTVSAPSAVAAVSGGALVLEDSGIVNKPSNAQPGLEARIAPAQPTDNELKDEPPSHRFSAVIEKIERLYMGKDSSDEEDLDDIPDDDQYDTEDSFIDDAELDAYFQVDNSATKHNGFFVNRGKLERMNEPPPLPSQQQKKRRRKDTPKAPGEGPDSHLPVKQAKVGKTAIGKSTSFSGKNTSDQGQSSSLRSEHLEDGKYQNQVKKKPADTRISLVSSVPLRMSNGDVSTSPSGMVDNERQNVGVQAKILGNKLRAASGSSDALHQKHQDKSAISQSRSHSSWQLDELAQPIRHREKSGNRDLQETNYAEGRHPMQATKFTNMLRKDGSSVRPKGSLLERAIRELEKMVAESRPPAMDAQDADTASQAVKRRLPREVKQKLAKVARLASTHGKISKELISRLMSILGHLMQLRTLKRNLKIMVNSGLSAKQEKDDRFHQIKKEVSDMINVRALPKVLEQAGTSDDFQEFVSEEKGAVKKKISMDSALEDKICDLYDLYVDGLDEDSGPQIRKLYTELAELWPNRCMDNHGIKRAVCRAKERKRMIYYQNKDQEKIRRKKSMAPKVEENTQVEGNPIIMAQQMRERSVTESGNLSLTSSSRSAPTTSAAVAARAPSPSVNAPNSERMKQDKVKMSFNNAMDDTRPANAQQPKKKVKRIPESEFGESHFRPDKLLQEQEDERQKSQKPVSSSGVPQKSSQQSVPPPTVEQLKLA